MVPVCVCGVCMLSARLHGFSALHSRNTWPAKQVSINCVPCDGLASPMRYSPAFCLVLPWESLQAPRIRFIRLEDERMDQSQHFISTRGQQSNRKCLMLVANVLTAVVGYNAASLPASVSESVTYMGQRVCFVVFPQIDPLDSPPPQQQTDKLQS